ncbi:MAG: bifunctional nuclease domain-containing protein [Candidatus Rokuibacteriota bacterium]
METDALLVRRVLAGDKPAFGQLVDRHRPEAVRLARHLLRGAPDAEDVAQEAFLHAFLSLARLRSHERFRGWLLGIVLNLARSRWRTRLDYPIEAWAGGRTMADPRVLDVEPSPEVVYESRELHRLVMDAIATLPVEQRDTVELHYVEGLKIWEIASLVEAPVGTIKARLHRARARLREALAEAVTVGRRPLDAAEEAFMVEVTVEDVIVRSPKGEPAVWLADPKDSKLDYWRVVLLRERAGDRVLPIWLHPFDGDWIAMRLVGLEFFRPVPHDLIARLLQVGDLRVEKVAVTGLREKTFYGSLWVRAGDGVHEIDARPSDAIAIALECGAPIFVAEETFRQAGVKVLGAGCELPGLEAIQRQAVAEGRAEPDAQEKEWRSFRSLPRNEGTWLRPRAGRALAEETR